MSLAGGMFLLLKKELSENLILILTGFAAGVLLSTAFIDLFPEALESGAESNDILMFALSGIVIFFLFERFLLWFHHHHETVEGIRPSILLITFGDSVHNFIDGVAIAGAFLVSFPLGVSTAIAVAAHEIPQEIADFSVMLSNKLPKNKIIAFNLFSALTSLTGAIGTFYLASTIERYLPMVISFTAGMFTYIAASDLIPELHRSADKKTNAWHQALAFLSGIIITARLISILHGSH